MPFLFFGEAPPTQETLEVTRNKEDEQPLPVLCVCVRVCTLARIHQDVRLTFLIAQKTTN